MYSRDSDHFAFLILVQDNYRIIIFDGSMLKDATSLKSHVIFVDGQDSQDPSDRYLHLHALLSVLVAGTLQKTCSWKN
jgi:hypothetical protein